MLGTVKYTLWSLSSTLDSSNVRSRQRQCAVNLLSHRHSAFCHLHLHLQIFTRRCCTRDTQIGVVLPLPRTNFELTCPPNQTFSLNSSLCVLCIMESIDGACMESPKKNPLSKIMRAHSETHEKCEYATDQRGHCRFQSTSTHFRKQQGNRVETESLPCVYSKLRTYASRTTSRVCPLKDLTYSRSDSAR